MVFWLYSAEQYDTRTPLYELAEHARERGFNDEPVDVLCLFGWEFVPEADRVALQARNFHLRDVSKLYRGIAARYPNLQGRYQSHFFECFLRWVVIREYYGTTPLLAWDADIFFNERLSRLHDEFAGATFTCSSTCFVALHDPGWLETYTRELDLFERSPEDYLKGIFAKLNELRREGRHDFSTTFFGERIVAALDSPTVWVKFFDCTPEEMFVDYLVRANLLPHHLPKGSCEYLFCPLPLILPQLAWVHPMGAGLESAAAGSAPGDLTFEEGRYKMGGRPLAFLHFQGAVFRACAAHQILHEILQEPLPIHDAVYCPTSRRAGQEIIELLFVQRAETAARIGREVTPNEQQRRWGNLYSERDVARNYLINSDLTFVLASYGLPRVPADLRLGKRLLISAEESAFITHLAEFFGSSSFLQVEVTESGNARLTQHRPGKAQSLVRETMPKSGNHWTQFRDSQSDTVLNLGSLALVSDSDLTVWLTELWRITGRNLWVMLPADATRNDDWWQGRFLEAGFRKHPLWHVIRPFAAPSVAGEPVALVFEKIPAAAFARHPLPLKYGQDDIHHDCLREVGNLAEARLARYELAAAHACDGNTILDAGCGLGDGTAILARRFPNSRVIGIDPRAASIDYARLHYGSVLANLDFRVDDSCDFALLAAESVDLVVSIDALEHLPKPADFLICAQRIMKTGAWLVGSVQNYWFDPSRQPPALGQQQRCFDLTQFSKLLSGPLDVLAAYRQIAGSESHPTASVPLLEIIISIETAQQEDAQWWILASRKRATPEPAATAPGTEAPTYPSTDTQQLNPQTAEIVRRFASETRHRPDFREVQKVLHRNQNIYATFTFPPEMFSIGYAGALANPEDLAWLLENAVKVRSKPIFAIEVGTFVGSTAVRLGQAFQAHQYGHLLCIDSFTGSSEMWFLERFQRDLQFQHGRPRIYELWMDNIVRHQLTDTVLPWCLTSLSAAQCLAFLPWVIDFIFLDSAHLQDETYMEIDAYWKVLNAGGLMAGDDYDSFPAVRHDVDRFMQASGAELIRSPSGRLWALRKPTATTIGVHA